MTWSVNLSERVRKSTKKLPAAVEAAFKLLLAEIELKGPVRGNWANYGKLGAGKHHCHLKKGRPTYVAVWEETDRTVRIIEVTYVGTHEKAPY